MLHNLDEESFDLFRYLLLGDQLKPWELQMYNYVITELASISVILLYTCYHEYTKGNSGLFYDPVSIHYYNWSPELSNHHLAVNGALSAPRKQNNVTAIGQ